MKREKFMDATLRCLNCPTEIYIHRAKIDFKNGGGMFCSKCGDPLMEDK